MIVKRIWSVIKGEEEKLLIFEKKELQFMILFLKMENRNPNKNEEIYHLYTSKAKNKIIIDQNQTKLMDRIPVEK